MNSHLSDLPSAALVAVLFAVAVTCVAQPQPLRGNPTVSETAADSAVFVDAGKPISVREEGRPWVRGGGYLELQGVNSILWAGNALGRGDFRIRAELTIFDLGKSAASFVIDEKSHFGFEGATGHMFFSGPIFGPGTQFAEGMQNVVRNGVPFVFEAVREGDRLRFLIDGALVREVQFGSNRRLGPFGLRPWRSRMRITHFSATGEIRPLPAPRTQPTNYSIPTIDLSTEKHRLTIVERTEGQYLGHPTTVLLADGKTIYCTYPLGHGGPSAVLKRSGDGGRTWSERLPVPENWATATNCPCLHRLTGPDGVERLLMMEGNGAMRQSVSLDQGKTWTPLEPNGLHCVVAPINVVPISGGRHLCVYHRGHNDRDRSPLTIWQSISDDGGLTWSPERMIAEFEGADLCEPALIVSPDGGQIAMVMRENVRRYNSMLCVTDDEGETWSEPVELPASLTGDRHMPRYAADGRLVMTFRDVAQTGPTAGDFVGWVGTYDDLVNLREGQYRVRFYNSPVKYDLGYPGLELLPDGTMVTTTYIVLAEGEKHSVAAWHFTLDELDRKAALLPREQDLFVSGTEGTHTFRIPSLLVTAKGTVLAFCEARRESASDFGNIDMVLKRSEDNGETWGPMQVLADDERNTMGNPCPVQDRKSGNVILLLCRNNQRVFVMRSADEGETFSPPRDITEQVKQVDFDWTRVATGPGNGIQTRSGRLVIPVWYMGGEMGRETQEYRSGVIFSDDGGITWTPGATVAPLFKDCNECEVVETAGGRLHLNMRTNSGTNRRAIAWSEDGGQTWSEPVLDDRLVEPVCDASLMATDTPDGPLWLFANCASLKRTNETIRASRDEGQTWPIEKVLFPGHSAYPCLARLADGTFACLYERGEQHPYESLAFARFTTKWLEDGAQ